MPEMTDSEWHQRYGEFIGEVRTSLRSIERRMDEGSDNFEELRKSISKLSKDVTMLQAKSAGTGALGGLSVAAVWELVRYTFSGK
jgi:hypothetical protein